jgi:hypothetical protein
MQTSMEVIKLSSVVKGKHIFLVFRRQQQLYGNDDNDDDKNCFCYQLSLLNCCQIGAGRVGMSQSILSIFSGSAQFEMSINLKLAADEFRTNV